MKMQKQKNKATFTLIVLFTLFVLVLTACSADQETDLQTSAQPDIPANVSATSQETVYTAQLKAEVTADIIPKAQGQVFECPVSVGDQVSAGALLYRIDDNGLADTIATTKNSIAKADLTLETANANLASLKVYAPCDGILENFEIKEGERVNASKIGDIVNEDVLIATVPFNSQQAAAIKKGDQATLISALHMTTLSGTVTFISDSTDAREDGSILRDVKITAENPGGFVSGSPVSAEVTTQAGTVSSALQGEVEVGEYTSLVSRGSGYAQTINVENGQKVKAGQLILTIDNDAVETAAKRAALDRSDLLIKLRSYEGDYADCTIYSSISGTIINKEKDVLDTISSKRDSIMTIADIGKLVCEISVSEEDVSKFPPDQEIILTTDSLETPEIKGIITAVDAAGKVNNGVLLYTVTITINNTYNLMPGTQVGISVDQ